MPSSKSSTARSKSSKTSKTSKTASGGSPLLTALVPPLALLALQQAYRDMPKSKPAASKPRASSAKSSKSASTTRRPRKLMGGEGEEMEIENPELFNFTPSMGGQSLAGLMESVAASAKSAASAAKMETFKENKDPKSPKNTPKNPKIDNLDNKTEADITKILSAKDLKLSQKEIKDIVKGLDTTDKTAEAKQGSPLTQGQLFQLVNPLKKIAESPKASPAFKTAVEDTKTKLMALNKK